MNNALLLVEFQNDYFPNGRYPLEKSNDSATKAQAILQAFRARKLPVIHVQHISTHPNASYLLPCTRGAEFYPTIQPNKGELIVKKHYPNSFKDTILLNYLRKNKIKHLTICGMMTHSSIDATVRAAYDFGFTCAVVHDACAARQLEFNHMLISTQQVHFSFLAALHPTYATAYGCEDILQALGVRSTEMAE